MTDGAGIGGGGGEAYRCGSGGDEAEAVVELYLNVPFREVFRGPFDHLLRLAVFGVFVFGDDACYVAGGVVVVGGSEVFCV